MDRAGSGEGLRLAELVASLSLATDLGLGQPMEHVLRSTLVAVRLAERLGVDESERVAVYYVALLAWVGCSGDSFELARWFGDDIALRADSYPVDTAGLPMMGYLLRHVGAGSPFLERLRRVASFLTSGKDEVESSLRGHCEVAIQLAERLGLGADVREPLLQTFERWDGKGTPAGLKGPEIALSMRLVQLAEIVEVFHRGPGGIEAAVAVARARRGTQFDPELVDLFARHAAEMLPEPDATTSWDTLIDEEPALRPTLSEHELDAALEAVADFADLKSPHSLGHSRDVAELAADAGRRLRLPVSEVTALRRAALVHDLGHLGIPNTILDKGGALSHAEIERVRMHPYYAERMLARPPALARLGAIAALHHERLDGRGYHRGLSGASLGLPARILAAADAYHAMTEPRPHRPALAPDEASRALREEVRAGRIDGAAADAVLAAAGHRVRRRREWPAGLTQREIEVLLLAARGTSNREIARALHISEKTVGNHVEHIYTKIGVSTRAAAALFAMQHGLLTDVAGAEMGRTPHEPSSGRG